MTRTEIDLIVKKIVVAREAYYNTGAPVMSDPEYDALEATLIQYDPLNPVLEKVGHTPSSAWAKDFEKAGPILKCLVCEGHFYNLGLHLLQAHKLTCASYRSAFSYSGPFKGKNTYKTTEETKERMRESAKNRKRRPCSDVTKKRLSDAMTGKKHSPETILKMKNGHKSYKYPTSRKVLDNLNRVRKLRKHNPPSEETRKKMSEAKRKIGNPSKKYFKRGFYYSEKMRVEYYYISSWELFVMEYLDIHPEVEIWEYEPFFIKYTGDDGKRHSYFPDFYVKFNCGIREVWEVKPQALVEKNKNKFVELNKFVINKGWNSSIVTEIQIQRMKKYYEEIINGHSSKAA